MYQVFFSKQAVKDKKYLKHAKLDKKAKSILDLLIINPFQNPPAYEKLLGDLSSCYSRRINRQHRIIYCVDEHEKIVKVLRMWTHYE